MNARNYDEVNWSVFMCSQNLPAILNDPNRGKQRDFFTKTWGESFVDISVIPPSPVLDDIPNAYFAAYYKKLLKRNKKYRDRKSSSNHRLEPTASNIFPQLGLKDTSQLLKSESNPIPKIYFSHTFTLSNSETFREVFAVDGTSVPTKFVQDKLSHYLDLVEVGLAQQISKKSSAFFSAVSTQDKVSDKVTRAINIVQQIKNDLVEIKQDNVITPLTIIQLQRRKVNFLLLFQKLQLMATVHQAQRAIQSLLGNSDYVGALDLISTTQDVLRQELQGLISFRHLDSQLVEIKDAIERMLRAELERNLSNDLNRPVEQMTVFCDKDRLISIIFGFLRLGKVAAVITVLAKEITTAMTTICKQTLIEAISELDSKSDSLVNSNTLFHGISQLPTDLWIKMIKSLSDRLVLLIEHIRDAILLFQNCADVAVGRTTKLSIPACAIPTEPEEPLIDNTLHSSFSSELLVQLESTQENADDKFTNMLRSRKLWLNKEEILTTLQVVKNFTGELEVFGNSLQEVPKTFRFKSIIEINSQISEFVRNFHGKQVSYINSALDREKWKCLNDEKIKILWSNLQEKLKYLENPESIIKSETGSLKIVGNGQEKNGLTKEETNGNVTEVEKPDNNTVITAEVFYILLDVLIEYWRLYSVTESAEIVLNFVELLRTVNSRIAHLILGAEIVELKISKSITVTILVVVLRGLSFVANTIIKFKDVFIPSLSTSKYQHVLKQVTAVHQEFVRHAESVENKMISILETVITADLSSWEAKPPVPSSSFSSVCRNIHKFREAIGDILEKEKLTDIFIKIDLIFRSKLKERISDLKIRKDGGPRHGVVTSEMMQYADSLRKLNILPDEVISNSRLTNDLWS